MSFIDQFRKQTQLIDKLGEENAYTAWVMAQYLEESDIDELAAVALTDGPGDKKIDFIHLDHDGKRIVFAQGFYASAMRDSAPSNKASDLNTACAWLLSGDIDLVPDNLRGIISASREAIAKGDVETIELIYAHNLPESVNVAREIQTVSDHLRLALSPHLVTVRGLELGSGRIQHLHDAQDSHIDVKDDIPFPSLFSITEKGPAWTAHVASVPGIWLHHQYARFGDRLFSANYRGFLGGGRRRRVNSSIIQSAEDRSADFWAFNNGITILTRHAKREKSGSSILSGMSIINGAQTTGSIGSVDISKHDLQNLRVLCRVIESSSPETIDEIIKFNNTQNAITSWDQYSNDPDQKRIAAEFSELGFDYSIKRGFSGDGDQFGVDEVIQSLLAYHGRPQDAVRGKNQIFDRKPLYQNAFDGKKARHILFVHTLSKAIDERRLALKAKNNAGLLLKVEEDQLGLMRNLRFKAFLMALIAGTLETAIGKRCDPLTVAFSPDASKGKSVIELTARWTPVVDSVLALVTAVPEAEQFASRLSEEGYMTAVARQITGLLHAMGASSKHATFAELVSAS